MPHTGQECDEGLAGDKISRCSIFTWSSKSGAELKLFTQSGQENISPVQPPTDGDVKSK